MTTTQNETVVGLANPGFNHQEKLDTEALGLMRRGREAVEARTALPAMQLSMQEFVFKHLNIQTTFQNIEERYQTLTAKQRSQLQAIEAYRPNPSSIDSSSGMSSDITRWHLQIMAQRNTLRIMRSKLDKLQEMRLDTVMSMPGTYLWLAKQQGLLQEELAEAESHQAAMDKDYQSFEQWFYHHGEEEIPSYRPKCVMTKKKSGI